jgi:GTPase SAR1 family protein
MKPLGKARSKTDEPFDYLQKVIIIGDSGVGKSNLLLRYSEGKFVDNYMMTIGINYVFKVISLDGDRIKLQIWDTAGQDKYKTITQNYYRNSQGVLIVYSIDSRESFNSVSTHADIQRTGSTTSPKLPLPTRRCSSSATRKTSARSDKSAMNRLTSKQGAITSDISNAAPRAATRSRRSSWS